MYLCRVRTETTRRILSLSPHSINEPEYSPLIRELSIFSHKVHNHNLEMGAWDTVIGIYKQTIILSLQTTLSILWQVSSF